MKRMWGGAVLLTAAVAVMPGRADAQRGARGQRGMRGPGAQPGVEQIMRLRDRLELSDGQIESLDKIRGEVVQHRSARQAEMAELRSRLLAGQVERTDVREQMEAGREAANAFSEQVRERVQSVLTDDQKDELTNLAERARAFQRGRASAARGGRGAMRGGRGDMRGRRGGWGNGPQGARPQRPMQRMRRGGPAGVRGPGGAEAGMQGEAPTLAPGDWGPGMSGDDPAFDEWAPDPGIVGLPLDPADIGPVPDDLESEFWWFELEPVDPPPPPVG